MKKKTPDTQLTNGRFEIGGEIVQKSNGEYYFRRSIQDYRINIEKSAVTKEELKKFVVEDFGLPRSVTAVISYIPFGDI
eukprot:Pgem_evm1s7712